MTLAGADEPNAPEREYRCADQGEWAIETAEPRSPEGAALLRQFLAEMITRYYRRPTDDAEIDRHLAQGHDSDDLRPPTGLLLLARRRGEPAGCVGLRCLDTRTMELTRMFVRPDARGEGAAEDTARRLGAHRIRLNTREDLVEARRLYAARGYAEIAAYGDDPLADHWFEKRIRIDPPGLTNTGIVLP
ncbi:GNAT family N-acetyltransferase [Nocardia sp. GTS18]|uniref:GNAT family N-acetyltransferase n=1 Tax=Nocardia sp. GTS18 TaxID=1778064 RepID=UPI0015EF612D|nr:GNAT family N-acetyltransferase [Nocardia sp. GTS18]